MPITSLVPPAPSGWPVQPHRCADSRPGCPVEPGSSRASAPSRSKSNPDAGFQSTHAIARIFGPEQTHQINTHRIRFQRHRGDVIGLVLYLAFLHGGKSVDRAEVNWPRFVLLDLDTRPGNSDSQTEPDLTYKHLRAGDSLVGNWSDVAYPRLQSRRLRAAQSTESARPAPRAGIGHLPKQADTPASTTASAVVAAVSAADPSAPMPQVGLLANLAAWARNGLHFALYTSLGLLIRPLRCTNCSVGFMTYFVAMLFRAAISGERALRDRHDRRTLICPSCRLEYANDAKCCIRCGSKSTTTVAQLKESEDAESAAASRLLDAKRAYDIAMLHSFCSSCRSVREPGTEFCPSCTQACATPPPMQIIYDQLHASYTDLVATPEDLQRIAQTSVPLSRQLAYGAFKVAGKGLQTLFR